MISTAAKKRLLAAFVCGSGVLAALGLVTRADSPIFRASRARTSVGNEYSVTMSPMGEVRFQHAPRRAVTQDANYNDILVALGEGSKLIATGYRGNQYDGFYQNLEGFRTRVDQQHLAYLSGGTPGTIDKELLYSLHADVHHIDPVQLATSRGWSEADVQEIARNVGPFFANRYSRENNYKGSAHYDYYSLWELSAKVGEVYRRAERIEGLKSIYDEMTRRIQAKLPPEKERPRVGLVLYNNGRFTAYSLGHGGFGQAQYRDVGARDAFEAIEKNTYGSSGGSGAMLDKEGLLAIDPDVLIVPFGIYPVAAGGGTSRVSYEQLRKLRDDPVAGRLKAFRSGRIYPGGTPLQGPIFYLFQIEMAAKQIYPEVFGLYRDDQNYPPSEQLFDRRRMVEVLNSDEHNSGERP